MRGMADEAISIKQAESVDHQLVRAIGVPALTANIVNSTIGAGIFVLPALVAKGLGPAAPLAFIACAIAMVLFVTCFAIAGSRVSLTGGLYAYVEVAFGRYVGFLAGFFIALTAICAVAGVVNVFVNSVAGIVPLLGNPIMRVVVIALVYGILVFINVRGVREGAGAVTVVTVGETSAHPAFRLRWNLFHSSGEHRLVGVAGKQSVRRQRRVLDVRVRRNRSRAHPERRSEKSRAHRAARHLSRACRYQPIIYILIQLVAQGTLGADLANYKDAPLAEAAAKFLGNLGRTILLAGATISAFGFVTSDILSSPRMLFAFGRDGVLPAWFAHVHPRYRSPDVAIITYAAIALALSVTRHL